MTIHFSSISIRNFLSYGNNTTIIQLDRPSTTTLILGEDLDNTAAGMGANGCGKTVLINALVYTLYDKPVSNISKDNLINNINKKNMEVIVEFKTKGKKYKVVRVRKGGSNGRENYVHIFEDDKDITPDSVSNTNNLIEQILGIKYELFVRIVVFSANHIPFLDLPVKSQNGGNQTDIIEELFDLTTLSTKAESLKETIKEIERRLDTHKARISQLKKEHERHQIQIASAKSRIIQWEQQNQDSIKNLKRKLKQIENVNFEVEKQLHDDLVIADNEVSDRLNLQRELERVIKTQKDLRDKAAKDLSHLKDKQCPYCLQEYKDVKAKIKESGQVIKAAEVVISEHTPQLETINTELKMFLVKKTEIQRSITVKDLDELLEIRNQSSTIKERIDTLTDSLNPFLDPLDELENLQIDELDYAPINELTTELEHRQFLLKLLTNKDSFVRKALLNKNLPFLNTRLQHYLLLLGLPHKVEFTHNMLCEISQFGRPLDFGNLSAGQKARVNIALSFAFRDVLQSLHVPINVCMLDEVLDVGLDTIGVQAAARMLKRKARDENLSLYIISHRDEIGAAFDKSMVVQMSNGFSYIKEGEE